MCLGPYTATMTHSPRVARTPCDVIHRARPLVFSTLHIIPSVFTYSSSATWNSVPGPVDPSTDGMNPQYCHTVSLLQLSCVRHDHDRGCTRF